MRRAFVTLLVGLSAVGLHASIATAQPSARERRQAVDYLRLGQDELRNERFEKARDAFNEAVRLDPLLELAHYGLGQSAMALKDYPAAVRAYAACKKAFLDNEAQAASDSAIAEQRIQDQVQQLKDTTLAITRGRVTTRDRDATLARLNGQVHELESRRHRDPDIAPQTPAWISIALGSAYFRTNAMADAEREYRAAVQVDPKLGEGHNNLAVVLMLTGRFDEAEREVKAAEESGFAVNPKFKADLKKGKGGGL